MKVYVCYECYYNYCDVWETVEKVFSKEEDALSWECQVKTTETTWRKYEEMELE